MEIMKKFIITVVFLVSIFIGNKAQATSDSVHHKGQHHRGHDMHGKRGGHHKGIKVFHRHHHHHGKDHSRSGAHSHHDRRGHGDKGTNSDR